MLISDCSSDVCSSDLSPRFRGGFNRYGHIEVGSSILDAGAFLVCQKYGLFVGFDDDIAGKCKCTGGCADVDCFDHRAASLLRHSVDVHLLKDLEQMAGIHPDNLNIVIEGTRLCFLDNSAYQRERKRCFVSSTPNFDHRIGWLARCVRIFEGDYAIKGTKEPLDRAQAVAGFVLDRNLIHDVLRSEGHTSELQ